MKARYEYECNECGFKIDDKVEVEDRDLLVDRVCASCRIGRYFRTLSNPLVKFKGEGWTDEMRN